MKPLAESSIKLFLLWLIGYPLVSALVSVILAGPVAAAEGGTFSDAFLFLLMVMTLTGIPLTPWAPQGTGGIIITLLLSMLCILVVCVFIGLSAGPLLDPLVDALGLTPASNAKALRKHLLVYFCGWPTLCIVFSAVLGGILAAAEDWPFVDGFVLALGECTLTGVTLPSTPPPTTASGKVFGLILGVFSQALLGIFIAVGSVPLLGFGLTFDGSPVLPWVPFLLNSEQKEALLSSRGGRRRDQVAPTPTAKETATRGAEDAPKRVNFATETAVVSFKPGSGEEPASGGEASR